MITKEHLQQELAKRIDGYKRGVETSTDNIVAEMKSILVLVNALPNYEKKYNEALARAKDVKNGPSPHDSSVATVEYIFPELRESEDERIRKEIIAFLKHYHTGEGDSVTYDNDWLVYLEKQKEQKPAEWSEEDEKKIGRLRSVVNQLASYTDSLDVNGDYCEGDYAELDTWLKSLRPQSQGTYKLIVHNIYGMLKDKDFFDITPSHRVSLLNDICVRCKNADEQAEILDVPSWKPSDEQMNALKDAIIYVESSESNFKGSGFLLESLLNNLQKL